MEDSKYLPCGCYETHGAVCIMLTIRAEFKVAFPDEIGSLLTVSEQAARVYIHKLKMSRADPRTVPPSQYSQS